VIMVQRKTVSAARAGAGLAVMVIVALLGLLVLGDTRLTDSLLESGMSGKTDAFRWTLPMIVDFPAFGVGRGAFEGGFQPYRGVRGNASTVYAHAENLILDWVSEWGILVGAAAVVGFGIVVYQLFSRARKDSTLTGLAAAVLAVVLGGMVDFGVEIFGIAALLVTVLSTANAAEVSPSPRSWLRFVPAGATLLAFAFVLAVGANTARADRKAVRAHPALVSGASTGTFGALRSELRAEMSRHPGDAYFPLVGAYLAAREGKNALPWLGRALERNPYSGAAHLALGEALALLKQPAQALLHLRLAAIYDFSLSDRALRRAVEIEPDVDALARAFPPATTGGSAFVDLCPRIAEAKRIACYREALRRDANDRKAQAQFALELLEALEARRAPCTGDGAALCEADAVRVSELLGAGGGYRELESSARILARKGDPLGAVTKLLGGCPATPSAARCLELAVELASKLSDKELAARAAQRFVALSCEVPARCASAHAFVAEKLEANGDLVGALDHLTSAAHEVPTAARWLRVADVAARAGRAIASRTAIKEAKALGPANGQQSRELERLEREAGSRPAP
jgi:tetratricopeptide (TPR) repeat protein